MTIVDIFSWGLLLIGMTICSIGILGIFTLHDIYARQHAIGLIESLGVFCLFLALILQSGLSLVSIKTALVALTIIIMSSPSCYGFMQIAIRMIPLKYINKEHKDHD